MDSLLTQTLQAQTAAAALAGAVTALMQGLLSNTVTSARQTLLNTFQVLEGMTFDSDM